MLHALIVIVCCIGCQTTHTTSTSSPPSEMTARSEAETIREFGKELLYGRDRIAEADVLKRFHDYASSHGLTFTVTRFTINERAAQQVVVRVFHGQQPIESFTFVPRDLNNLALIGG